MKNLGKYKIIDNLICACDYDFIIGEIEKNINKRNLLISPIASHTLVKAYYSKKLKKILDRFDFLLPDSQWIKRALRFLYQVNLEERVYGPELMKRICHFCSKKRWSIFLYGNTESTLDKLEEKLKNNFPSLRIGGKEPSKFRKLSHSEMKGLTKKIEKSQSSIVFISLGSPNQEIFAYRLARLMKKPVILIPVGAAFDFISGVKKQAPKWVGNLGFEWLWRLIMEPRRLFRRYLADGIVFIFLLTKMKLSIRA